MQANSHSQNLKDAAEEQANFIMLRALENKLPPGDFESVLKTVRGSCHLPKRIDWMGNQRDLSFEELKVNFAQVDQNSLSRLVEFELSGKKSQKYSKLNNQDVFLNKDVQRVSSPLTEPSNMLLRSKNIPYERFGDDLFKKFQLQEISRFERMKTVFGHCLIDEGCHAPIYNIKYDQTDNFIISGADDCHEDVITDIDISKCNRYLASASIDGKIIVWDWQNCKKLDEISDHRDNVNNIKFFSLTTKVSTDKCEDSAEYSQEEIQILVSCSEDGTIRIYDEIAYLEALANQDNQSPNQGRRSNRSRQPPGSGQNPPIQRLVITLQPEDFRVGGRVKKINTVHINKNGTIAAGTDKGDVLIWTLDLKAFLKYQTSRNQNLQIATFVDSFKPFSKAVHFCEFSPQGNYLFVGSDDGTAKIWKIDKGKFPNLNDEKPIAVFEEKRMSNKNYEESKGNKKSKWDCDSIAWSVNGRYAIAAISGKTDEDDNHVYCILKVWDSFTGEIIQDFARDTGANLRDSTFVLAPHPKIEEIFMSGGEGGVICLWNIRTGKMIKQFLEYGIYSYEKYTMNDPKCGRFSNDGSSFVVGSGTGTLSLFSCDSSHNKYAATRVEQFFQMDDIKHNQNIYYELDDSAEPQICGYSLIPYECQPSSPLIGKFKNSRLLTEEEYERNLFVRQQISKEEEEFLMGQLSEGLENDMFQRNNHGINFQLQDNEDEVVQVLERNGRQIQNSQNSFQTSQSSIEITNARRNYQGSLEDRELLNQIRRGERQVHRSGRRGIIHSRNVRNIMSATNAAQRRNPNFDPDNSLYDRESDENFVIPEVQSVLEEEEDVDMQLEEESSNDLVNRRGMRGANRRVNVVFDANDPRRPPTRHQARQEESKVITVTRRTRRGLIDNNSDLSRESDESSIGVQDESYQFSDIDGVRTRGRQVQRNESRKRIVRLPSSDDDSAIETDKDNQDENENLSNDRGIENKRSTRNTSKKIQQKKNNSKSRSREKRSNNRNLRNRSKKVNYNVDETISFHERTDHESEEEKQMESESEQIVNSKSKRRQRAVVEESFDEKMEDFDDRRDFDQDDYILHLDYKENNVQLEEEMINKAKVCEFCSRSDGIIIGPFSKINDEIQPKQIHYFHQDCLEVSNTTYYNKQKNKWMNIGKALEKLHKKPTMCDRCGNIGATIKCIDCRKCYHGYYCSYIYMIFIDTQKFQCFECRNKENFKTFIKQSPLEKKEYNHMKRDLSRNQLLITNVSKDFIPQIGDQVYYFFQGHEKFIGVYNCFFYCGDEQELNFIYPWQQNQLLLSPTLCKITKIQYNFPSNNAMHLLKRFGKTMDVPQVPQIITRIFLEITIDPASIFFLDYFSSELPNFLVPRQIYESQLTEFQRLSSQNQFVGQVFKKRGGAKYRILGIKNLEDSVNVDSNWLIVQCQLEDQYRLRGRERRSAGRRDRNDQEPPEQHNFWDFEFSSTPIMINSNYDQCLQKNSLLLIEEYIARKSEDCAIFMDRVDAVIAPDYRYHIAGEMYLTLITQRLSNGYYRSLDQVIADLDQIYNNSRTYNSEDNELTILAKKIVDAIKRQLRTNIQHGSFQYNNDHEPRRQQEINPLKIIIESGKAPDELGKVSKGISKTTLIMNEARQGNQDFQMNQDHEIKQKKNHGVVQSLQTSKSSRLYQEEEKLVSMNHLNNKLYETRLEKQIPQRQEQTRPIRLARRAAADMGSINQQQTNISSGSKITINLGLKKEIQVPSCIEENGGDGGLLGKSTRVGRNRKVMRRSLKEDSASEIDYDEEFNEEIPTKGSKKRSRYE